MTDQTPITGPGTRANLGSRDGKVEHPIGQTPLFIGRPTVGWVGGKNSIQNPLQIAKGPWDGSGYVGMS